MTWTVDQQLELSATQAVEAIQAGQLKAADYVATLLARAQALSNLNALTVLDVEGALAAAQRIDALGANERARLPLAGLPVVVKDNINTRGLQTSAATPALEGFVPARHAPSVQRLVDAGAILLGKANMHELAFGITSTNLAPHAGPVRNPWDPERIPGGSSGGTAAAVAARIVPAGLGTDTGGSTRIPAALCGIVGLRPSVGDGGTQRRYHDPQAVVPISHTRDTVGPMGRTVADVALLDAVITGHGPLSPAAVTNLRIGLPAPLWEGLEAALEDVARAALAKLEAAGVTLVPVEMSELLALNDRVSYAIALHEPIEDLAAWLVANRAPAQTVAEVAARIASPDVRAAYDAVLADARGADYHGAMTVWRPRLQQLYAQTFAASGLDALLFPTTRLAAVPIDELNGSSRVSIDGAAPIDEMEAYLRNTDPASNAGIPGLALPAGLVDARLPVGLELDGPAGGDRRLLAIGLAFEAILGTLPAPEI
ncbi:indoleacetamide hydrolase [Paraburkholderia silvatlantica]|uniref:Mandelamide amidase n=1 Tax=Paraburkholderia silvatlantica TaxID=321895 RepID=A0ABR6FN62_9BURK|nr:indoleacetamide hydrolase [Paraburkholderia silvatlantica]MBB2928865.1 mandelamide amidase [Paraburkholderia silvatlantica]PVY35447.1 mandelamide amidase [Paraburkholderia silvatlantica]PXW41089.1 mandelamide amidase [Paraburkholderia silvatlantica]TDQ98084.1 mandelamide amidase [Paraburkholderia silvatlantica]